MSETVKVLLIAVATAAVLGTGAILWSTFSKGVEAEMGDIPAITELKGEVTELKIEIKGLRAEVVEVKVELAGVTGTLTAVKDQGNAILAILK